MSLTIDAHVHIWDRLTGDYTWLTPSMADINADFDLDDFAEHRTTSGVDRVILVQAADTDGDTDRMIAAAATHPEVAGVVAWLPLTERRLPEVLTARVDTGLVVGARALIHNMPDKEWILRDDVGRGLHHLANAGLSYDYVTSGPDALQLVPTLAARHPNLRIVIDHLGKPPLRGAAEQLSRWRSLMRAAASAPNVAVKLSGYASATAHPASWTEADLRPVVQEALEAFGPDRLIYGGDWPVCALAGGYEKAFRGLAAVLDVSASERELIYGGNARSWYRIDERQR